jgi:hypothetical protein
MSDEKSPPSQQCPHPIKDDTRDQYLENEFVEC